MGRSKVQNIFGTYLRRQSTLVLESQPHLFIFNLVKFGAFFELFLGLSGLFFGLGSDSKKLLLPTYIDNQLWFWKYSHIFLFSIWPHLGPFLHFFGSFRAIFLAVWGLCVVGVRFKNIFGTYLCRKSTLVLEIQPYLFVYNLAKFGAFFTFFGPFEAIFGVGVKFKKNFETYLHRLTTIILEV